MIKNFTGVWGIFIEIILYRRKIIEYIKPSKSSHIFLLIFVFARVGYFVVSALVKFSEWIL